MRNAGRIIIVAVVMAVWLAGSAGAQESPREALESTGVSLARQRLLKAKLQRISQGSLDESLAHNRRQWESLTPDQRHKLRERFLAFLRKDPQRQEQLLRNYEEIFRMTAQRRLEYRRRAQWLGKVVASFTQQQRDELRRMSPEDRAARLIRRRDELIAAGKLPALKAKSSTTQPAAATTTQPSKVESQTAIVDRAP